MTDRLKNLRAAHWWSDYPGWIFIEKVNRLMVSMI